MLISSVAPCWLCSGKCQQYQQINTPLDMLIVDSLLSTCRLFIWSPCVGIEAKNISAPGLLIVCAVEDLSCALLPSPFHPILYKLGIYFMSTFWAVHLIVCNLKTLVVAAALADSYKCVAVWWKHFIDINCIKPHQSPQKFYAMLDTLRWQAPAATAVSSCPQ